MFSQRERGEIRVGDLIEFNTAHEYDGILTNMIGRDGEEWEVISKEDQCWIKSLIIHQASDSKFAVWPTDSLPANFTVVFKQRPN